MHNFQTKNFQILQLKIPTRTVCISKCPVRGVAEGDLWHVEWYCSAGKVFIGLGFRPHFWPNFKTNFGQILTPALSESLSKGPGGPSPLHGPTVRRLFSFFCPAIARGPWRNKKPPAPVWEIERNTGQAKMLYQRSSFWNRPWTSHPPRIWPTEKICPNAPLRIGTPKNEQGIPHFCGISLHFGGLCLLFWYRFWHFEFCKFSIRPSRVPPPKPNEH